MTTGMVSLPAYLSNLLEQTNPNAGTFMKQILAHFNSLHKPEQLMERLALLQKGAYDNIISIV